VETSPRSIVLVVLLIVGAVTSIAMDRWQFEPIPRDPAKVLAEHMRKPEVRAASFVWDGVPLADRQAIEQAIAAARPEARRLIDAVDGVTTIRLAGFADDTAGRARPTEAGYEVELDLADVQRRYGQRGISRLVLHELGHVIDDALLDDALRSQLDAAIPPGHPCDPGVPEGACAPEYERFAETFAKWATGDIGVDVYLGYKVPPPALEPWGAPLAALKID
jgi:hypothetical protein